MSLLLLDKPGKFIGRPAGVAGRADSSLVTGGAALESPLHPAISVVLAVCNGEQYLPAAMDSVLNQSFANFELLVIDDGSTDQTAEILRRYARRDPRVKIFSRPNRGLTVSLNEGLSLARGDLIARMDADDLCMPDRFARQVEHLRKNPDCVLVGSRCLLIDPDGLPIRELCLETTHDEIDQAHLNRGWPMVHPAVMVRASALKRINGYREEFRTLQDMDLFLRLAEVGKLANLPMVLLWYRQHLGSVTHTKQQMQVATRSAIYEQTWKRRGLQPLPPIDAKLAPPRNPCRQHQHWAWAALKAGYIKTARKHALITLRKAPWRLTAWRLLACALRGH